MADLWLTPVKETGAAGTISLGGERIRLGGGEPWGTLRGKLQQLHPRLVPLFKANMLLGDEADADDSCGAAAIDLRLDDGESILLGAGGLPASHCALSFFDRLLSPAQSLQVLERLESSGASSDERHLAQTIVEWLKAGSAVIVLQD
ncbi:hypothetical protein [Paenibacillus cymbidii]|uniref:hypothetical protein n=1 Tax=Paenibacillus cymbidii TaxID=1639034 RepID=UPI0010807723|nr:hypothetical protein [Paenibacillus cymbidii]